MRFSSISGIDIGHHCIKLVVLKKRRGQWLLVHYADIASDEKDFHENNQFNLTSVAPKLKTLKKSLPLGSSGAVLSLANNVVMNKTLAIKADLEAEEQASAIYHGFSQHSPFPIETLMLDYVKTQSSSTELPHHVHYQVYATRKDIIENREALLQVAGFSPVVVDMQSHVLLRVWTYLARQQGQYHYCLIEIGCTQASLCLVVDEVCYYKEVVWSSGSENDLNNDASVSLIEKLQQQLRIYASLYPHQPIQGIWLSGGGAHAIDTDKVSAQLALPVERISPFDMVSVSPKLNLDGCNESAFILALGLALTGIEWLEASEHGSD